MKEHLTDERIFNNCIIPYAKMVDAKHTMMGCAYLRIIEVLKSMVNSLYIWRITEDIII